MTRAYLDHASTSPVRPAALEAMWEWMSSADPGRVHTEGRMARVALEDAREKVAALVGTRPRQVVFTSGATEAINAAVFGALSGAAVGAAVVMSPIEHSAVRESSQRWASRVIEVGVSASGVIDVSEVRRALDSGGVALVHCQMANHEVGTLQPVAEVASLCRDRGVLLHVDAAAAVGHVPCAFDQLGADLMSITAHKLGGPKGIGALLVRRGLRVPALLLGGEQERARRAGLEDVAAAVGFGAAAVELTGSAGLEAEASRATGLVGRLRLAAESVAGIEVYGPIEPALRLPHLLCLGIDGVEAEPVLIGLDQAGVAAHSGSSCASESLEPSPVLAAMGVNAERSLRLSVGWSTTDADIDLCTAALPPVIARLRAMMSEG